MAKREYAYQNTSISNMPGEKWKAIPALEGYYTISNLGRVKRLERDTITSNGQLRHLSAIIMKPNVRVIKNKSVGDNVHFLRIRICSEGRKYSISIGRIMYYCFIKKFDLENYSLVVIPKDGNGKNLHPGNLMLVNITQKQQRIFERNRYHKEYFTSYDEFINEGLTNSSNAYCKQISQYTLSGKRIQVFPSIAAASEVLNIPSASISNVAHGRNISCKGFIWRFGKQARIDVKTGQEKRALEYKKTRGTKVTQYDETGKKVASYLTIKDAARATNAHTSEIIRVVDGRQRSAGGYVWKKGSGKDQIDLSNYMFGQEWRAARRWKKVKQYSKERKYVQTFPSLSAAAESISVSPSIISLGIKHKKPYGGFFWKFA
ncbi:MAG: NUMOD1 domain-containing DNA-binding protein [Agriterribacter sp.]